MLPLSSRCTLADMQISDWTPLTAGSTLLTRNMSYIKPLAGSFGPKQAKCELRDEMIHFDPEGYITMLTTTRTPEVPSGSAFSVKSRTCITWAGACATRIIVTSAVEWTGSSFIKGLSCAQQRSPFGVLTCALHNRSH